MHTHKKTSSDPAPLPSNPLMRKLRERKIFETIAAFIGVGWLILEFVHWILVDHYKWPERMIDLAFITILGALCVSLTLRWFRASSKRRKWFKVEYILIPIFLLATLALDIHVLMNFHEEHEPGHKKNEQDSSAGTHQEELQAPADSIAVLPFRNLNTAAEKDLLHEGMTEALIGKLSALKELRVTSRTSVMRYQDSEADIQAIGRALNVASILEGSVQKEGRTLRIRARLFSMSDGFQIWSETYDKTLTSLFAVQDEIAESITEALKISLAPDSADRLRKHSTDNLEAYNLYLQGRLMWARRTRTAMDQAIDFFKQAVELDPSFALAYSGIADSLIALANTSALPPNEAYPEARDWARKALRMDNSLAEAHASIALTKLFYEWDWEGAERKFQKALEVNPSYAFAYQSYALYLASMDRREEARTTIEKAVELDPASNVIAAASGVIAYLARDFQQAAHHLGALVRKSPEFSPGHLYLGWLDIQDGKFETAVERFRKAQSLSGGDPRIKAWLGYALWKSGDHFLAGAAHRELEELATTRYIDPSFIALLHLGMEETDQALEWLEKGFSEHSFLMAWLNVYPIFDPLRGNPRFQNLIKKLNFPN